jgi:sialate O-acetylesterase
MAVPGFWEDQGLENLDGAMWYRKTVKVPASMLHQPAKVFLGRIVDADELYINGIKVGETGYMYPQRRYTVPDKVLKAGENIFVVHVINHAGKGGFVPDKPYQLMAGNDTIDLTGYWQYKVGYVKSRFTHLKNQSITLQYQPTALYNAMVSPLTQYSIRGFVWYQGESNTGRPDEYAKLQPAMIKDWRRKWNEGDLPFLFVQLPGFGDYNFLPGESQWATFRAAQEETLLVPNSAMAVAIDAGAWNDVHPDMKKPVGNRLAAAAEKIAYHENNVYSGPVLRSATIDGNKIILSFDHTGSGLIFKDGSYQSPLPDDATGAFVIAGDDKKFVPANANIKGNTIIVFSPEITSPKYVRYAWADDPLHPDLYNKEGLPAVPFRTDTEPAGGNK